MNLIKSFFRILKSVILFAFLSIIVIFMVNNREIISLNLFPLPFVIETRIFVALIVIFLLGALFSFLVLSGNIMKISVKNLKNRHQIKKLQEKANIS